MRDFPPTNERRSQGLLTHLRTVTMRALGGSSAKKYAQHTPPETHPVQNSPCSADPPAHPVQNSPNTPKTAHFQAFWQSRENYVPLPTPRPPAGRTLYRTKRQTRYKTPPTHPHQQPNRYKTLPTRPKRPISARFARAGRTMYRFHPHDPQQRELCTAPRAKPGTKLSLLSRPTGPTGTKLSQHAQKGPFQPVLPEQGELSTARSTNKPSRENYVPLAPPRPPAGRTLYRT